MFALIESIFLSDVLIFLIVLAMLGVVTSWALRQREYPGYVLGWLVAIFFVIVYNSLPGAEVAPPPEDEENVSLSFLSILMTSLCGLLVGFAVLLFVRLRGRSRTQRGVTIALLTSSLIIMMFFLSLSGEETRRVIGIFSLAFAIGALVTIVIGVVPTPGGGGPFNRQPPPPEQGQGGGQYGNQAAPRTPLEDAQKRFERLRRRIEGRD